VPSTPICVAWGEYFFEESEPLGTKIVSHIGGDASDVGPASHERGHEFWDRIANSDHHNGDCAAGEFNGGGSEAT